MKRTIICMTEEELKGFQDELQRGFSVRLAFKAETEEGETEEQARQAYQAFFDMLKGGGLKFRAYTVVNGQPPQAIADLQPSGVTTALLDDFRRWFESHAQAAANLNAPGFWALRNLYLNGIDNTASLDAHAVLVGASSWVAPVPQCLGLAYVLHIDYAGSEDVVFQPLIDDALSPGDTEGRLEADDVEFAYASGIADFCSSNRAIRPAMGDMLIDPETGFVNFGKDDSEQAAYRTLTRIEQRAGSLFTGFFAVSEVQWKDQPSLVQRVRRESWRALATLATSLDTLLLALMMPHVGQVADSPREGGLLGPLLDVLIERLKKDGMPSDTPRSVLRKAIRGGIQQNLISVDMKAYIDVLLDICRPQGGQGTSSFAATDSMLYRLLQACVQPAAQKWKELEALPFETLSAELAPLQDAVLSENGFESTVLRLLHQIRKTVSDSLKQYVDGDPEKALKVYDQAVLDFEGLLNTGLNGADAARQSVGKLICDTVLHQSKATTQTLEKAAEGLEFWNWRLGGRGAGPTPDATQSMLDCLAFIPAPEDFFTDLPKGQPTELPADKEALAALALVSEHMQRTVQRELFVPASTRFSPDLAPGPLAIPLTVDPVVDDLEQDEFSAAFSGMALALRRTIDGQTYTPWAYANLADFHHPASPSPAALAEAITVQPVPTTINDGRRSLFLHYDGLPLACSAFDESLPGAGFDPLGKAFFGTDYPATLLNGFQPLPTLAYGARYEVCAHVVGRSGSLPRCMQGSAPWLPAAKIEVDGKPKLSLMYSRRTAIGRTTINDSETVQRLGVIPAGLQPLSADYPRLGLHSDASLPLDLFRQVDGSGALHFDAAQPSREIYLEDFRYSGPDGGKLTLSIYHGATLHTVPAVPISGTSAKKALSIVLEGDTFQIDFEGKKISIAKEHGVDSLSLRLGLTSPGLATVSFADPAASVERATGQGPKAENLLLLGASFTGLAGGGWRAPFGNDAALKVNFPRVPYSDFVRWIANPDLRRNVFTGLQDDQQIKLFLCLLEAANIDRSRDLELGKLLDALLDPAVSSLRLDVVVLDGLMDSTERLGQRPELKPQTVYQKKIPSLGEILASLGARLGTLLDKGRIKDILTLVDKECRHSLSVRSFAANTGQALSFDGRVLHVPAGTCVQLLARPQVESGLFSAQSGVLDSRLETLAIGRNGNLVVFDGARVLIESMQVLSASREEWTTLAHSDIHYEAAGTARSYMLKADPSYARAWQWRQLGAITVLTQRWRFDGRPIYAWINPKENDVRVEKPGRASRLLTGNSQLANFEIQAFAGRDRDGQSSTINLLPAPASTTLRTVHWEKPSATVFRHRFTLHSRYTAAFQRETDGWCQAWSDDLERAWLRVAMLAEAARIELTRPQLRALIPLTQSPEEGEGRTPPLMAILQERPFAHGGLADRVIAEVRSGVGYAMSAGASGVVHPADVRKEIGRDPRLAYEAYDEAKGKNTLLSIEGPIGLTFESDAVSAPAFPNTALVLDPVSLEVDTHGVPTMQSLELEEHFLSVGLRRYLHPHWLVSGIDWQNPPDLTRNCWIQLPGMQGSLSLGSGGGAMDLVKIDMSATAWEVTLDWRIMDITATGDQRMSLLRLPTAKAFTGWQCALLHAPMSERRALLSVFLVPPTAEERGAGNAPKLLASIEWTLPAGHGFADVQVPAQDKHMWTCEICLSQSTSMHWARTNRNFATVFVADGNPLEMGKPRQVKDLQARLEDGALKFNARESANGRLWLRPAQGMQPFPTHTQRHLALLFSEVRSGLGRPLERPTALYMLGSNSLQGISGVVPDVKNGRVRVVEFETPAIIIGRGAVSIPDQYKFGYLDLVAPGIAVPPASGARTLLSLNMRLVANLEARSRVVELRLGLRPESTKTSEVGVLELKSTSVSEWATFGVDLSVDGTGKVQVLAAWAVDRDGMRQAVDAQWLGIPWNTDAMQGLVMTVEPAKFKDGLDRELWLEVAMLATSLTEGNSARHGFNSTLDLDWFFGADPLSPDTAASEDALRGLHEVQARIISVSPLISMNG
ncbi:hypothetical protein [Pseudomonas fluorescens]|uniref:Uncharacterized protein n=1 Tax=Pseudomonas fluorescens TaxID=294 RepID=A0A5E6PU67_PSEFL|nr:hypothetical protein [Pseudomonas fluorescens]VVM46793.1 hypothetical protein PS655_00559 [Pseudomonas fluorescens]